MKALIRILTDGLVAAAALGSGCGPGSNGSRPASQSAAAPHPASWERRGQKLEEAGAKPKVADAPAAAAESPSPVVPASLAASINLFARDLHREFLKPTESGAKKPRNLFYSPLSISIGLTMTWAGARERTAAEMAKVMHLDSIGSQEVHVHSEYKKLIQRLSSEPNDGAPEVRIANRLFVEEKLDLVPEFAALARENYGAPVEQLDFAHKPEPSRLAINAWAATQTQNRVKEVAPKGEIDVDTGVVLINAIYFKGRWVEPFSKNETRDEPFYVDGKTPRRVPTMRGVAKARYAELADTKVLELPYARGKGPAFSMVIILPKDRNGLAAIEQRYGREGIAPFVVDLREAQVRVFLPRFGVTTPLSLKRSLQKLGMPAAFTDSADLSGIIRGPSKIADVHHKAFVQTDEEGTEAAAATAVAIVLASEQSAPDTHVDHPFLFAIRDVASGVVLFTGRIVDPTG